MQVVGCAYGDLLVNLAVGNHVFTPSCLKWLVRSFRPIQAPVAQESVKARRWSLSEKENKVQGLVLATLTKVILALWLVYLGTCIDCLVRLHVSGVLCIPS